MDRICDKWDLRRDVRFNTQVTSVDWKEGEGKWKLIVRHDGKEVEEFADVIISAQGFLKYDYRLQHMITTD